MMSVPDAGSEQRAPNPTAQAETLPMPSKTNGHEPAFLRVIPFNDWCKLRGFSRSTGLRIIDAGRVKVTRLSARRLGIREDHDREYLDSCARASA